MDIFPCATVDARRFESPSSISLISVWFVSLHQFHSVPLEMFQGFFFTSHDMISQEASDELFSRFLNLSIDFFDPKSNLLCTHWFGTADNLISPFSIVCTTEEGMVGIYKIHGTINRYLLHPTKETNRANWSILRYDFKSSDWFSN